MRFFGGAMKMQMSLLMKQSQVMLEVNDIVQMNVMSRIFVTVQDIFLDVFVACQLAFELVCASRYLCCHRGKDYDHTALSICI